MGYVRRNRRAAGRSATGHFTAAEPVVRIGILALLIGLPGVGAVYLLTRDWSIAILFSIVAIIGAAISDDTSAARSTRSRPACRRRSPAPPPGA